MELKRLISHFTYCVEPKPGGGFIAQAADPTVAPLEAPTREELQKKIQQSILPAVTAQFPTLRSPLENQDLQFAFHIEPKPDGGFLIHSSDPKKEPIEVLTHNELERYFAEKISAFVGKRLPPELSQLLASSGNSGDIKISVKRKGSFSLGLARNPIAPTSMSNTTTIIEANAKPTNDDSGGLDGMISNAPIEPEFSRSGKVFGLMLLVLVAGALVYFFLYLR